MSHTAKRPDAIIFDLGGVIIDVDFKRVFAAWAQTAGIDAAPLHRRFEADEVYQRHERGEISAAEFFEHQRRQYDLPLSDQQFLDGWNAIFGGEIAGIETLIRRAARIAPCYVFSNTNAAHQAYWEPVLADTLKHFEKIFVSNELGERKPDASAFLAVCNAIGVAPADALFFDDTDENLHGARDVGLQAVKVGGIEDVEQTLARFDA